MKRPEGLAAVLSLLRGAVDGCPHCVPWHRGHPPVVLYRRSARALTLRCGYCGLQWTVTYHRMAQASAKWLAAAPAVDPRLRPKLEDLHAVLADLVEVRPERRGRRRRPGPPLEEASG